MLIISEVKSIKMIISAMKSLVLKSLYLILSLTYVLYVKKTQMIFYINSLVHVVYVVSLASILILK